MACFCLFVLCLPQRKHAPVAVRLHRVGGAADTATDLGLTLGRLNGNVPDDSRKPFRKIS